MSIQSLDSKFSPAVHQISVIEIGQNIAGDNQKSFIVMLS
ncbi:hypothetical protein EVA_11488 [gut metagenome]|uniref:Uncharacterized protein n=1 Tax=gut metagenome TaxID=749906 RepID=J9FZJ7_9ZZZZ